MAWACSISKSATTSASAATAGDFDFLVEAGKQYGFTVEAAKP
jgi:hypothetical protein